MPTLLEEVVTRTQQQAAKLSMLESRQGLSLEASSRKESPYFRKLSIDLSRIPVISANADNDDGPIIIDINAAGIRRTGSGFVPKTIILSGANKVREARKTGNVYAEAWVGGKVLAKLSIQADGMSSSTLSDKIRSIISKTYSSKSKGNTPYDEGAYAYVVDIYPFDSYCIFAQGKEKYRQGYKLSGQDVVLDGKPVKVYETYIDAPFDNKTAGITASNAFIDESLKDKPNNASPALGGFVGKTEIGYMDVMTDFGAPGSELNNPMLKLMLNVEEALTMYMTETAKGIHKVVYTPYAPIPSSLAIAAKEATIAATAANVALDKFSAMDFMKWQNKKMSAKAVDKKKEVQDTFLTASAFAYVGDANDPSTWHMPIATPALAAQSLREIKSSCAVPRSEKSDVLATIKAAAKKNIKAGDSDETTITIKKKSGKAKNSADAIGEKIASHLLKQSTAPIKANKK